MGQGMKVASIFKKADQGAANEIEGNLFERAQLVAPKKRYFSNPT